MWACRTHIVAFQELFAGTWFRLRATTANVPWGFQEKAGKGGAAVSASRSVVWGTRSSSVSCHVMSILVFLLACFLKCLNGVKCSMPHQTYMRFDVILQFVVKLIVVECVSSTGGERSRRQQEFHKEGGGARGCVTIQHRRICGGRGGQRLGTISRGNGPPSGAINSDSTMQRAWACHLSIRARRGGGFRGLAGRRVRCGCCPILCSWTVPTGGGTKHGVVLHCKSGIGYQQRRNHQYRNKGCTNYFAFGNNIHINNFGDTSCVLSVLLSDLRNENDNDDNDYSTWRWKIWPVSALRERAT